MLKATENNHIASESNLRVAKDMLVATEQGVEAANQMEAANAVIRMVGDTQQSDDNASLVASVESRHKEDLNTQIRRSLDPVRLPDRLPEVRGINNRFGIFFLSGCLVLAASAVTVAAFNDRIACIRPPPGDAPGNINQHCS